MLNFFSTPDAEQDNATAKAVHRCADRLDGIEWTLTLLVLSVLLVILLINTRRGR